MIINFEGHHGTSMESATLIQKSNYILSLGDKEWLGDGVYFFISGVSTKTLDLAEKWAVAQSWDKHSKMHKYSDFCILKSTIEVNESNLLDLTNEDGVEVFEYLVDKYISKLASIGKKMDYKDGVIINLARKEEILPIEVVKGNFYIRFVKERIYSLNMRTSNCTICTVYDPIKNIKTTKVVKTGKVSNETN